MGCEVWLLRMCLQFIQPTGLGEYGVRDNVLIHIRPRQMNRSYVGKRGRMTLSNPHKEAAKGKMFVTFRRRWHLKKWIQGRKGRF
jgi:hypothetical protein